MSVSCPHCAAQMPDAAAFCPGCGRPMVVGGRAQGRVGALPENIAGALAYFTFIPAVVFLLVSPYNKNRFVRFHSFQCLFLWIAAIVIAAVVKLVGLILFLIPMLGHLLMLLIQMVLVLGGFVIWLVLVVKSLQGEEFLLPVLGDFAEQRAAAAYPA